MNFQSGDYYEGQWANSLYHGHGTYYFNDGSRWEGPWKYGKDHGEAKHTHPNGNVETQTWVNGVKK